MDRTRLAALASAVLGFATVAGLGVFLGFPTRGSVITGLVTAVLAGALLLGAGRRAETFHPTDPTAHLAEHPPADDPDPTDDPDAGAARG